MLEEQGGKKRGTRGRRAMRLAAALGPLLALSGCGFFVNPNGTSSSGTTSSTVYIANATAGTVSGYVIGAGTLTAVSGLPGSLGFAPQAAVVSLANTYLWIAGPTAIYGYSLGSSGVIATVGAVASYDVVSMDVSPDGQWLVGLDATTQALDIFQIDTTTGGLILVNSLAYTVTSGTVVPHSVRFAPNGDYIFAALGPAGDAVFSFNTSSPTGTDTVQVQSLATGATTVSDNAVLVNSASSVLYIARSGTVNGVMAYTIGSSGALTQVTGSPFAAGTTPYALQMDSTGAYLYVANRASGTISGFSAASTGVLTALTGSPFTSGTLVQTLALDSTGTYLFSGAFGGAPDLTMYGFSSTIAGALTTITTETPASNDGSVAIAVTH